MQNVLIWELHCIWRYFPMCFVLSFLSFVQSTRFSFDVLSGCESNRWGFGLVWLGIIRVSVRDLELGKYSE